MTNYLSRICGICCIGLFSFGPVLAACSQQEPVDFHKDIKPLFEKYCVECHGLETTEAFRIDLKSDAMDYITPDDSDDSQLYQVLITDDESELMPPPDEENPLSEKEIELVKLWIEQGANWPELATDLVENKKDLQNPGPPDEDAPPLPSQEDTAKSAETAPQLPAEEKPAVVVAGDQRIYRAIGSLHPAAIHLPIGLLLAAGLFAFFSLRGNFVMSDCAYYCLWLGALGCVVACATGWWAAPMKFRTEGIQEFGDLLKTEHRVFWHRTGGLVVAVLSIVLAMFAASARNRDPDNGLLWKLGLMLLAIAVGWVGHEGGKLTHGNYHYKDLNSLASEWFPSIFKPNPADAPKNLPIKELDPDVEKSQESDEELDKVGNTSVET